MINRAFFAVAGFAGLCLSVSAPQTRGADQLQLDRTLDRPSLLAPSLSLEDSQRFFFSTLFGWMQPTADFLPAFHPVRAQSLARPNVPGRRNFDDDDNVVDLRSPDRIRVGGEVGFLYGRSSGKYGIEYERGHVIGEVGNA